VKVHVAKLPRAPRYVPGWWIGGVLWRGRCYVIILKSWMQTIEENFFFSGSATFLAR
jgi:hypothetical protein